MIHYAQCKQIVSRRWRKMDLRTSSANHDIFAAFEKYSDMHVELKAALFFFCFFFKPQDEKDTCSSDPHFFFFLKFFFRNLKPENFYIHNHSL